MTQMPVTQSQMLIHQRLGLSWILRQSPKCSRTPSRHRAAKEVVAAARRRRANRGQVAATGLDQARQSTVPAVVAARAKRRKALRQKVKNLPHPPRPRVAVRSRLHHLHQRRIQTSITVLVPRNTPNLRARVAPLQRVAAARVAAVRVAAAVVTRIRTVKARASIALHLAHQRANLKGALPLIADQAPQASRKIRRVIRNHPHLRVATSQNQRAVVDDAPLVVARHRRDAASTRDIVDRNLGAAVDRQVMGRAVVVLVTANGHHQVHERVHKGMRMRVKAKNVLA